MYLSSKASSVLEMNVIWHGLFSPRKLFRVSCTLETWRRTVQHLINSTQLIIVDLSYTNEGLKWELNEIMFYGATNKVIFVAYEDRLGQSDHFWKPMDYANTVSYLCIIRTGWLQDMMNSAMRLFLLRFDLSPANNQLK